MSIPSSCKYLFTLIISASICCSHGVAFAQADTTAATDTSDNKIKKQEMAGHQLNLGIDVLRPALNQYYNDRFGYEFEADYYLRNEFYVVAESGWGGSKVNYDNLQYNTGNYFARAGFNKSILARDNPKDWDMMFFGLRAGYADIKRGDASFIVTDSVWGSAPGTTSGKSFSAYWFEVVGGMRVELIKGVSAGWTMRGKFLMNGHSFQDLAPLYIAGYGRGDKNVNFDFNVYVSYAIRWKRKHLPGLKDKR